MLKVSVIVPVFNVEKYVNRCLDSLVNQTLKEIEIILINDASTDNSLNILLEYQNKYSNIKVIDSKINLKQGGARNLGIKMAAGSFVGFVDSDDWVSHEMYEKLYDEAMKTNSDVVDSDYFVSDGAKVLNKVLSNTADQVGELTDDKKKSLIINSGRMWTKIYKKELFTANNIEFPEKLSYEDNPVVPLVLVSAKKLGKVNEHFYYYFKNVNSTTSATNSYHHFDRLETSIILLEGFKNRNLYHKFQEELEYRFSELYYINTIYICLDRFDKPEIERLYEIRNYMKSNFNNYRKNKYFYRVRTNLKIMSKLNDIQPSIMVKFYNLYKSIRK